MSSELIPLLISDIDCNIMARAFENNGDFDRAEKYYQKAIENSPSLSLKMFNLRAYARFNFLVGRSPAGRQLFEEAVLVKLPNNDSSKSNIADTYMLWSVNEFENGFIAESHRIRGLAIATAEQIAKKAMREERIKFIEQETNIDKRTIE